jgi:hypothetical protein
LFYGYVYYKKYTEETSSKLKKLNTRLADEQSTRKRNINSVVDQINDVNNDISNEITNTNTSIQQSSNNISSISRGIESVFSFTSNTNSASSNLRLYDLPGSAVANTNLLSHVTALGGFNINDLYYTGANAKKQFKINGTNNTEYVTIPDENGAINVKAAVAFNKGANLGASISAVGANQGYIKTKSLGLGASAAPSSGSGSADPVSPNASMHIMTTPTTADATIPFKISVNTDDVLKIRKSGVMIAKGIYLSPNMTDTAPKTKIEVTSSGELIITPPGTVSAPGTLYIDGNIKSSGTITAKTGSSIGETSVSFGNNGTPIQYSNNEGFTSGPIVMEDGKKRTATPVDYMNSRYLLPKPPACM